MPKRGAAETLDLVQAELARTDISDDRKLKRIYIQTTKWIVRNLDGLGPDRPPEKSSPCSLKPPGFPPPIVGTAPLKNLAPTTLPRSAPGNRHRRPDLVSCTPIMPAPDSNHPGFSWHSAPKLDMSLFV